MDSRHFLDDIDFRSIKAIAFDCFGTLCNIQGQNKRPYKQLLTLLQQAGRHPLPTDARTIMSSNCGLVGLLEIFGHIELASKISEIENDVLAEVASVRLDSEAVYCVSLLSRKWFKVALCSNLAKPYAAPLISTFSEEIHAFVWSFEVGAIKPEPAIFQSLCDQLQCLPSEVLFVGDSLKNDVEGARAFGMQALYFYSGCGWTLTELAEHIPNQLAPRGPSARLIFDNAEAWNYVPETLERDPAAYDSALISVIPQKQIKVAMVLCKAAEILGLVATDSTCDYLISRLKLLVASGQVETFGDINRWRFSEVCRK